MVMISSKLFPPRDVLFEEEATFGAKVVCVVDDDGLRLLVTTGLLCDDGDDVIVVCRRCVRCGIFRPPDFFWPIMIKWKTLKQKT